MGDVLYGYWYGLEYAHDDANKRSSPCHEIQISPAAGRDLWREVRGEMRAKAKGKLGLRLDLGMPISCSCGVGKAEGNGPIIF